MTTILVTGCNTGLGFHAVQALSVMPDVGTVILACRNTASAEKVVADIVKVTNCNPEKLVVLPEPCDLSELVSVRQYAIALKKYLGTNGKKLMCLVNNAGVGGGPIWTKNSVGHDMKFATNHLGHYLLTLLLLPLITDRIVNVSSEVHDSDKKTTLPDPAVDFFGRKTTQSTRPCCFEGSPCLH